jgi:4-amino-4-deoxy-L-arabinose transferase-like glycosyltransferase
LLVVLWALVCLPNLGGPSLWDIDEGNNAECSQEMLDSGNFIVPTFNYRLRDDKPVLIYWLQIACSCLVGVNEWAARLPSALASLATVLCVYELGRGMFGVRSGLQAGLILGTSFAFLGAAHFANPDALLVAFTTLSLALFWHDWQSGGKGWLAGVGIAAGLGVLAKGPIGLVLPAAVALGFLVWQRQLKRLLDWRVPSFILAFLFVAAPWYIWVALETKGEWVAGFWGKHNTGRFRAVLENHSGPVSYYVFVLLVGLAPWSIFLGGVCWHTWTRLRRSRAASKWCCRSCGVSWRTWNRVCQGGEHEQSALRFLTVWFAIYFVFFSLSATKLPNYILPLYPAVALLTGHFLERWRSGELFLPAWYIRAALLCLGLIGVAVTVGMMIVSGVGEFSALRGRHLPGAVYWAWLGLVLLGGSAVASWLFDLGRRNGVIVTITTSAGLFAAVLLAGGIEAVDRCKAPRLLAGALPADHLRREVRVLAHDWFQPSIVFYTRREVERIEKVPELSWILRQSPTVYLYIPENTWRNIYPQMPTETSVLARRRDLYTGKMILLVTNDRLAEVIR